MKNTWSRRDVSRSRRVHSYSSASTRRLVHSQASPFGGRHGPYSFHIGIPFQGQGVTRTRGWREKRLRRVPRLAERHLVHGQRKCTFPLARECIRDAPATLPKRVRGASDYSHKSQDAQHPWPDGALQPPSGLAGGRCRQGLYPVRKGGVTDATWSSKGNRRCLQLFLFS